MNVKNRAVIRRLSFKTLWASRKRNRIAVAAIALTALLFTSLFTIVLSINESNQTYTFRQIGGYSHGSFKEVTKAQAEAIAAHPKVKEVGLRKTIGILETGEFAKSPAELSFMDKNCTDWSYANPTTGHRPEKGKEITMDTTVLAMLGIKPELGARVELTWQVLDRNMSGREKTDTFTLAGWWDYDTLSPVHYINVSEEYADALETEAMAGNGDFLRIDLNVMMASSLDIEGQIEQVNRELGALWEQRGEAYSVRIGANWGYTSARLAGGLDFELAAGILAFLCLVVFTGYLIIYNIFQISVSGDIRFYGLLKTIGVTPRQLKRIIRLQALLLCSAGIPLGLVSGYGVGALLVPQVMKNMSIKNAVTVSASPSIFLFAAFFALGTVLMSCSRPGKLAAAVSPVEAVRYTENSTGKRKTKRTSGAKVWQMALANLGRSRVKTALVVISLALSVVLFHVLTMFVGGFDMEKYLEKQSCADFIVSDTAYFRNVPNNVKFIEQETIQEIKEETTAALFGSGYTAAGACPQVWMEEAVWKKMMEQFAAGELLEQVLLQSPRRDMLVADTAMILGLDVPLFEKLRVVEGELSALTAKEDAIAVCVHEDDYGNIGDLSHYPKLGETVTITYSTDAYYIDSRTGEKTTEQIPDEYIQDYITESHDVTYHIAAYVVVPGAMGYRYRTTGLEFVLPVEALEKDSRQPVVPMYYLFDTPDAETEAAAESYLAGRTEKDTALLYESKATIREEFQSFQTMFLLLGGLLCAIIGAVGILNFFNAIMTGILSRQREFAVLQAVGMTGKQLRAMLVYEGLFYAVGSAAAALLLSIVMNPMIGEVLENLFWFFSADFSIVPVLVIIPGFAFLGWLLPTIMYGQSTKKSVVERLREV